ncbi:hypothetical protein [Streptomyces sp. UH6]|uniref:hypothetical protein n=1 Tax=Streptomyces sp. UH6 TaxID=2748379 RepID=UPI0015D4A30B|nr:hypothetical protein [Streptomyces sp. UH6]NYV72971.1 hypothetical protein [Streptomyces sp. UH6]
MSAIVDVEAAARSVNKSTSALRMWASKGWIHRHGYDRRGRLLVDVQEVTEVAQRKAAEDAERTAAWATAVA